MTSAGQLGIDIVLRDDGGATTAIVKLSGEFDRLHVERFDAAVAGLTRGLTDLLVDLSDTTIVDSAALGALIRLRRSAPCALRVKVERAFQVTVMEVTGLWDLLGVERG